MAGFGGKGRVAGAVELSPGSTSPVGGRGGSGGGGGKAKAASSDSDIEVDATAVDDEAISPADSSGILGPAIEDLNIGGFPGGGAPVGFNVG